MRGTPSPPPDGAAAPTGWSWITGRWARTGFLLVVLAMLAFPAVSLAQGPWGVWPTGVGLVGILVFAVLLTATLVGNWHAPHTNRRPKVLVALVVLAVALVPVIGYAWLATASYFVVGLGVMTQPARRWPLILAAVLAADVAGVLVVLPESAGLLILVGSTGLFGLAMMGVYRIAQLSHEVTTARSRLAHAVVAEERLRIARDLHDVLGQRLSGIALKSEWARRILRGDPDGAEDGLAEVAATARETLTEVRATLSGYRGASLNSELAAANTLLRSVGCELSVEITDVSLTEEVDACAAWLVREAVTNIMRHARARHCTVSVVADEEGVSVTVVDDGPVIRAAGPTPVEFGVGLSGLRGRVHEVGGTLEVVADDRTFTLRGRFPENPR